MKLLVNLKDLELDKYLKYTNSFLVGIENLSVNSYEASLEDIKGLLKDNSHIELFINLNKNMFSYDINNLKEVLIELSKLPIKGVFFYDLSILEINLELNLGLNLVISQDHLITNYNICNYYYEHGVKYANLSSDITSDEIIEIADKTNIKLIVFFVGHLLVSHSKRKLVDNYYQFIDKEINDKINIIKEKDKDEEYYILNNHIGTNILTKKILNGNQAFLKLKDYVSYGIFDSNMIDDDIFLQVLKLYNSVLNGELKENAFLNKTNVLIKNCHDGFFDRKTIYKVK